MILSFRTTHKGKPTDFEDKIKGGWKRHTIREDLNNRWQPGKSIQFATGARTQKYEQFDKGMCVSTQKIEMEFIAPVLCLPVLVWIDGRELRDDEIRKLVKNDGFDDVDDFIDWFRSTSEFTGKIIHWTDLRY